MREWKLLLFTLFLGSILGGPSRCGNTETVGKDTAATTCESGQNRSCMCPGDTWGVQYCINDGNDWNNCNCRSN